MEFIYKILIQSWGFLAESSVYILFGILVAGLLRVFLSPAYVSRHLGGGRFLSVFKAAILGIPIPLCSCGTLPAAASLKKQGANNGATMSFLISTPESGVDSIAITYALMDPIMTVARPVAAFISATFAGIMENLFNKKAAAQNPTPDLSCPVDNCCDGADCPPEVHNSHHAFTERLRSGLHYAFVDLWGDIAGWFFIGFVLAGIIATLAPQDFLALHLGGGITSMLIMLAAGIPLYICATASTPIAAALVLKGVSPGAALVFLLAGPATNIASLTVLTKLIGKRAMAIYLGTIAVVSVGLGLLLDQIYLLSGVEARAVAGKAGELIPPWAQVGGALVLISLSLFTVISLVKPVFIRKPAPHHDETRDMIAGKREFGESSQTCNDPCCQTEK